MKSFTIICVSAFILVQAAWSQDFTGMKLECHFPLTMDLESDNCGTMKDINARIDAGEGTYSYGGYVHDAINRDSTLLETDDIDALSEQNFGIYVEFKLVEDSTFIPIFMVGDRLALDWNFYKWQIYWQCDRQWPLL